MSRIENAIVVVVDDQEASRAPIVEALLRHRFKVVEADGGRKALEIKRSQPIAAIITDIAMPHGDGVELLREAKYRNETFPVFLMSHSPELYSESRGYELADGIFKKPVNTKELIRAMERAIGQTIVSFSLVA